MTDKRLTPKLNYVEIVAEAAHEREFDLLFNEFGTGFVSDIFEFYDEKLYEEVICENDNFMIRQQDLEWKRSKLALAVLDGRKVEEAKLELYDSLYDALGIYLGSEFAGRYRDFLAEHQDD